VAPGAMLFASLDVKASEEVSAKKHVKEAAVSAAAAGRGTDYGKACAGCGRVPRTGDIVECEMAEPSAPGGVEWLAGEVIRADIGKKEMTVRIQDETKKITRCHVMTMCARALLLLACALVRAARASSPCA